MTIRPRLLRPLLAATVAAATIGGGAAAASTAATQAPAHTETSTTQENASDEDSGKLLLMLDSSGSMNEDDPSGGTKMDAAKKALTGVVDDLPKDANVGLRVYGAKEPGGKPTKAACADTQLEAPIKPLDRPGLKKTIKGFTAKGETPIAHSLEKGLEDLGDTGKRNIVLVSDGEESCVPDPCPVVKKLAKDGVDLRIDTVGFDVSGKARKQLQCLADAGNGSYYDAEDAEELSTSLTKLSQQAVRQFSVMGSSISMTEDSSKAPTMKPGRYTDTFSVSDKPRHATLTRTPDSVVHVGLVVRPPARPEGTDTEEWKLTVETPDGEQCADDREADLEFFRNGSSMTLAATINNRVSSSTTDDPCASASELLLSVEHEEGGDSDLPVQIIYVEEPPVKDAGSLPEPVDVDGISGKVAKGEGSPKKVVGGGGFVDAAELEPGSYEEVILPGEQLYYRVALDYGQEAAFTADIGPMKGLGAADHQLFTVDAWTPALHKVTRLWTDDGPENRESLSSSKNSMVLGEFIPEVRYRNKEVDPGFRSPYDDLPLISTPGYYYFAIGRDFADEDTDAPVTVRIDVDVDGKATGQPTYHSGATGPIGTEATPEAADESKDGSAEDSTDASSAPAARSEDDGASVIPWVGGGAVVALLLGAGTWVAVRRLRTGRTG